VRCGDGLGLRYSHLPVAVGYDSPLALLCQVKLKGTIMSDQTNASPAARPAFWRRGLAGFFDFLTVFFVGGYVIGSLTGETTKDGFNLSGLPALALLVLIVLYFYLGWKVLGGTLWQRVFGARPVA
jgi:hypothetical protein